MTGFRVSFILPGRLHGSHDLCGKNTLIQIAPCQVEELRYCLTINDFGVPTLTVLWLSMMTQYLNWIPRSFISNQQLLFVPVSIDPDGDNNKLGTNRCIVSSEDPKPTNSTPSPKQMIYLHVLKTYVITSKHTITANIIINFKITWSEQTAHLENRESSSCASGCGGLHFSWLCWNDWLISTQKNT